MKYIQIGKNHYRRAKWYERNEVLAYTIASIIFWAVVLTALFI